MLGSPGISFAAVSQSVCDCSWLLASRIVSAMSISDVVAPRIAATLPFTSAVRSACDSPGTVAARTTCARPRFWSAAMAASKCIAALLVKKWRASVRPAKKCRDASSDVVVTRSRSPAGDATVTCCAATGSARPSKAIATRALILPSLVTEQKEPRANARGLEMIRPDKKTIPTRPPVCKRRVLVRCAQLDLPRHRIAAQSVTGGQGAHLVARPPTPCLSIDLHDNERLIGRRPGANVGVREMAQLTRRHVLIAARAGEPVRASAHVATPSFAR